MKSQFYTYICELQDRITNAMEKVDGEARFKKISGIAQKVVVEEHVSLKMDPFSKRWGEHFWCSRRITPNHANTFQCE